MVRYGETDIFNKGLKLTHPPHSKYGPWRNGERNNDIFNTGLKTTHLPHSKYRPGPQLPQQAGDNVDTPPVCVDRRQHEPATNKVILYNTQDRQTYCEI